MLSSLKVSNLAIVEEVKASFTPGLNVITGETGAGKSVLMGALELVLGARADAGVVREGAKDARIDAEFDVSGDSKRIDAILEEAGLPECEDSRLYVRRVIPSAGAAKVWINDTAATVATLKKLSLALIDVHGPRANQSILLESFQRGCLDEVAQDEKELERYHKAWEALSLARAKVKALSTVNESGEDEIEILRYQVDEFESVALCPDDETLSERHASAAHAGEIVANANEITLALGGDSSAFEMMMGAAKIMRSVAKHLPEAESWLAEAEDLSVKIQELSREVASCASRIDISEEEFKELDDRLTLINKLKRKYLNGSIVSGEEVVSKLLEVYEHKKSRLDELLHRAEYLAAAEKEASLREAEAIAAAKALTKKREKAVAHLDEAVTSELHGLGFNKARFFVKIEPSQLQSHGADTVNWYFEPNVGEAARPLKDIASSGEIARVMLAVKAVVAEYDAVGTLVFDEIDANVGGEIAKVVGSRLREVARYRQVIAITHLPQSAVYGENHLKVFKSVVGGRTRASVAVINDEERISEIARLLGGETASGVVRKHAEELLKNVETKT